MYMCIVNFIMNDFILDPIVDFGEDAINVGEDILNTINPANWSKFHFFASFNKDAEKIQTGNFDR